MKEVKREQVFTYIDITPTSSSPTWKLLGQGITEFGIDYNPQVTTAKYIIDSNASSTLDSNQKQGTVSQKIFKGDPCFDFANSLRDKTGSDVEINILDIDGYDEVSANVFKAKMSKGILVVTKYMKDTAVIEYTIYYNGNPTEGTANTSIGTPVFTANSTSI